MTSLEHRILKFIDTQLEAINKRPGMWGPSIAVELQIIQLLEFRSVVLRPSLEEANPRAVLDAYGQFLARRFPQEPPVSLASLLAKADRSSDLTMILGEFRDELVTEMLPESPFSSHDLVLKLWLREGVAVPRASTLSSYYDIFRRVLRAVSRPHGTRGRAKQDIEEAIDFAMPDVAVSVANGAPAHITLPLDQLKTPGANSVKNGVQRIVAVNEWAAQAREPVRELERRLQGQEVAQRVAAQTLRLMPSTEEAISLVEMGGILVGRTQPIRIEPSRAERLVEVVKQSSELSDFDETGSVRAVDMDQRSMRLRLSRTLGGVGTVQCWMEDAGLVDMASKAMVNGQRMRVTGSMYKDPGSPAMVIVRKIQL